MSASLKQEVMKQHTALHKELTPVEMEAWDMKAQQLASRRASELEGDAQHCSAALALARARSEEEGLARGLLNRTSMVKFVWLETGSSCSACGNHLLLSYKLWLP